MITIAKRTLGQQWRYVAYGSNGKMLSLDNIHFYKDGEILISYRVTWEEKDGDFIHPLGSLPYSDIPMKIKQNLGLKIMYLLRKSGYIECSYDLYIPADMVDMSEIKYETSRDTEGYVTSVFRSCEIPELDMNIKQELKWLNSTLYEYESDARSLISQLSTSVDLLGDNFNKINDTFTALKALKEKRDDYISYLQNYTVDDYFRELEVEKKSEDEMATE